MFGQVLWIQHPVGHGGFHTGHAVTEGGLPYTWIYDCGSRSLSTLRERLRDWAQASPDVIDWLYISHFDSDHVNGLKDLFELKTIDSVMLPFVNYHQLTLELCDIVLNAAPSWLVDMIADPVGWLSARGVRRIVWLGSAEPDLDEPEDGTDFVPFGGPDRGWKERITPRPQHVDGPALSGSSAADVYVIRQGGCSLRSSDGHLQLRFKPFRVRIGFSAKRALMSAFVAIAGTVPSGRFGLGAFAHALARKARAGKGRRAIQAAYAASVKTSNRSSMSLLSILEDDRQTSLMWSQLFRGFNFYSGCFGAVAWGSTGDAELKRDTDLRSWSRWYRADISKLAVLSLPHHGSDENSDAAFQYLNRHALLTAQVKTGGSSHHPGPNARHDGGARLQSVSGVERTTVSMSAVVLA